MGERAHRMNLPHPFSYRFCRDPAIILSAGNDLAATPGGAGRQPGAGADMDMIGDARPGPPSTAKSSITELPATPTWATRHAMAADLHIVGDLDQIIELAAFADHRVAQRAAVDGGGGADLDPVLQDDAAQLRNPRVAR